MPQIEVVQFETLIHPGYHLYYGTNAQFTTEHITRKEGWDKRVANLATNPQTAMFYFSQFINFENASTLHVERDLKGFYTDEQRRIEKYKEQLSERFFLFPGFLIPHGEKLKELLTERGFSYNPDKASLYAYGEFFEQCVDTWRKHLTIGLGLQEDNSHRIEELCLKREHNPFNDYRRPLILD
jgi:hypothetical protein